MKYFTKSHIMYYKLLSIKYAGLGLGLDLGYCWSWSQTSVLGLEVSGPCLDFGLGVSNLGLSLGFGWPGLDYNTDCYFEENMFEPT